MPVFIIFERMKNFITHHTDIFDILTKTISEGIVIVNQQQHIVASNQAANTMFGYETNELIGLPLETLIPQKNHSKHHGYAQKYVSKGKQRQMGKGLDLYGRKKNEAIFPVEVGLSPFTVNDSKYIMALVTDITERKEQQEKILHLNTKLEQLVVERTQELQVSILDLKKENIRRKKAESKIKQSLEKERELGELKTKFLSMVSHEFKTPLSVILSSATLAGKYKETHQQEKREKHLDKIKQNVKSLNNILNDFLSIEQIESGNTSYHLTDFPLIRVINHVIYEANMASKEGQNIQFPDNIQNMIVHFDEKILRLSLTNIINNALKYSEENTTITIAVETSEKFLYIHIKDEGIGIPEEEQKFIFNPYFRAENALLKKGTGIGLNIVKRHLESLNSFVYFKSKKGEGSTFTLRIPYKQE